MLLTTAIDYTNGSPHIGHAYEKVLADVISRYQRLAGRPVYFLTGVDQHGQKVEQTAAKEGVEPIVYVKRTTQKFLDLWQKMGVGYSGWAETTDPRHISCVQKILMALKDKGELYKKSYNGHYSVRQEQFLTDRDRDAEGNFGSEWGEIVEIQEENWYFKLSNHTAWLKDFLDKKTDLILPSFRKAELMNSLEKSSDVDLCISRPKERLKWGIELPFDPDYVTYVWFDALINYVSFAGYEAAIDASLPNFSAVWNDVVHVIGKDILVPAHGIYWYCMLHAMGFTDEKMPQLLVHGWWNSKGEKMSKSIGNVIDPNELVDTYGVDTIRYYLMRDISTGKDSDFDQERVIMLYNTELANVLGNLCNRALNMSLRANQGILSCPGSLTEDDLALQQSLIENTVAYSLYMNSCDISKALEAVNRHAVHCNVYAERMKPWELKNSSQIDRLLTILYHLSESVAHCAVLLSPIIPEAAMKLFSQLNAEYLSGKKITDLHWGLLPEGHQMNPPQPVFPRIGMQEKTR
jgi:methionyl-tRNA synthetase